MTWFDMLLGSKEVVPLTEDEAKRLVDSAKNNVDKLVFLIELNSGISMEELLTIRVKDINFSDSTIAIFNTHVRTVRLPPKVINEIKGYLERDYEDKLLIPIKRDMLQKRLAMYQNVVKFNWRVLRHTYTDLAIKKGVSLNIIAENIGIPVGAIAVAFARQSEPGRQSIDVI